jgi:hypothetical protein
MFGWMFHPKGTVNERVFWGQNNAIAAERLILDA